MVVQSVSCRTQVLYIERTEGHRKGLNQLEFSWIRLRTILSAEALSGPEAPANSLPGGLDRSIQTMIDTVKLIVVQKAESFAKRLSLLGPPA